MSRYFLLTFVVLLSASLPLQAQTSAEEVRINEVFKKTQLSKVFRILQEKYHVNIAYDNTLVQNIVVALNLSNLSLTESFERLLEGTALTFQKVGDNVIILPRPPEPIETKPEKKDISLSGTILDGDTQETLPQATILVHGTNISATSNNDGKFTILRIPSDTCSIVIRYLGYITQTIKVKDIDTSGPYAVKLKSDTRILNEVVVLDEYNQAVLIENKPGEFVFNPKSLSSLPSLGEQDINRTLQLIPGITATDESSSGMIIRGSYSSYNLTLLDGITIYQQDHLFGSFSIINSDIIKDVHLSKGMFDAKYGGRVSGVVDITSKNGNTVKPAFNIRLNSIAFKGTAEIPLGKKWSLFTGARKSIPGSLLDDLFGVAQQSNDQIGVFDFFGELGSTEAPPYSFFDTNTKLSFRPTDRDVLSLSLYVSRDNMDISSHFSFGEDTLLFRYDSDELTRWGNTGVSLKWSRQWNSRYYSNVRVSVSRFFRNYTFQQEVIENESESSFYIGYENDIRDVTYALDNEWMITDKVSFNWGLLFSYQQTDLDMQDRFIRDGEPSPDDEIPTDTTIAMNDFSWQESLYGSVIFSPVERLTLTAGTRLVYYYNKRDQLFLEPRLIANYKLTEQLNLKTGYGRSNQFISQLIYYPPTGAISGISENYWLLAQPGSEDYPVISSDHVSTGATLRREQFVFDAEVFYKESRGIIIDENINSGRTYSYGLDFMVQKTSGIHKGWIAYTLSEATQKHPDIENGKAAPTWQDQRHEVKVVDMLMLGNWNLSSTLIFGSGKPYPKYIVTYIRDENDVITDYETQLDYSNHSRLPAYFSIDLAASYTVHLKKSGELQLGLSVHNVTHHQNLKTRKLDTSRLAEAVLFNTEIPATYTDVVLLGFTPTLSVGFTF